MSDKIISLLIITVVRVDSMECPNHCFCYTWKGLVKTDCVRRNLFNTFVGFSHQTQVLDLSHNVISILHGNEFLDANLRQLQDLRLSNNRLYKIDKFSFNGLEFLQNLDLSFNFIEYLNPLTFKYNPNIKSLNVSFNPLILKKNEPFLSATASLQVLDMANCQLEFVSSNSFTDLNRLRILNISKNYIRKIEPEFLDTMKNLRYLDVSRNDFPCHEQTKTFLQSLIQRKIQFQAFCKTSQTLLMIPATETKESNGLEMELHEMNYNENVTQNVSQEKSTFDNVTLFFKSIPSFYAIVCGVQFGVFIGSFSTYVCLRKSIKNAKQERETGERAPRYANGDSDNLAFALISMNTPPGTPPSPYHSRFFPSNFSLSAT